MMLILYVPIFSSTLAVAVDTKDQGQKFLYVKVKAFTWMELNNSLLLGIIRQGGDIRGIGVLVDGIVDL